MPQSRICTVTLYRSHELSELKDQDVPCTAGKGRTNTSTTSSYGLQYIDMLVFADPQRRIYTSALRAVDTV